MDHHEISLLLRSRTPILMLETHEEIRALDLIKDIAINMDLPIFKWSVATGLQRIDLSMDPQAFLKDPTKVLEHINSAKLEAVYVLLDFHPYLEDAVIVRHLKEVAMGIHQQRSRLVMISHKLEAPPEIRKLAIDYELSMPDDAAIQEIIRAEASAYARQNADARVTGDKKVFEQLVNNLRGLTFRDARTLAHRAIFDDGAITESDLPEVMKAKYDLLSNDGLLSFEFETSSFSDLAGMGRLKTWLHQREKFFHQKVDMPGMDTPRGILLLGVQGCGKSMAAKAVAGVWGVPLLRLDFGSIYNKYIGESESNIREALNTAEVMAPCVLWIDELEKGISISEHDSGTSQRILGTLLTWMAENNSPVFIVATSNDIQQLPPELIRKGRLDEVFFVDLPSADVREAILRIHAKKRGLDTASLDLEQLARLTDGFSGSEIEQLVVSAIYAAHAVDGIVDMDLMASEIRQTQPLSVLMGEKIAALRSWAEGRTVPVD
jgi:SpoVK/Ycf46/Vps4 family AAA+-type ATPase